MTPQNKQTRHATLCILVLALLAHLCSIRMVRGAEQFVSDPLRGLTVEIRADATVAGDEIRLRQIARWSDTDKAQLDPVGELLVAHFDKGGAFRNISVEEIKGLLRDAGVNVATMNFAGPMACRVNRADATFDQPGAAIEQYTAVAAPKPIPASPKVESPDENIPMAQTPDGVYHNLRQLLTADVAMRVNIPAEDLQITFRQDDEVALRMCEPHFKFDIQPQRAGTIGDVSWDVDLASGDKRKRLFIRANVRAWRQQVVVARPLATKQLITADDVVDRRTLVDTLTNDPLLKRDQIVGQMSSRELKPGAIVTANLVDPVQLIRGGQFATIESTTGGVTIRSVVRAMESGSYGQTIRVKNEETNETFNAIVTGPQLASLNGPGGN